MHIEESPVPIEQASELYAAALKKKTDLQMKLRELESERANLEAKMHSCHDASGKDARLMSEAEMILSGQERETTKDWNSRLDVLAHSCKTLRRALAVHEKETDAIRSREGARLGAGYAPFYRQHTARVALKLQEIAPLLEEEYRYRRAFIDAGYPTHALGEIFALPHFGRPGDPQAFINTLLARAREYGLLK